MNASPLPTRSCWGRNTSGQTGGFPFASPGCSEGLCEPASHAVAGLPPLTAVGAGFDRTCGVAADDTLWCWGSDVATNGPPHRIVGPWETNGDTCFPLLGPIETDRHNLIYGWSCMSDADCTALPFDVPCDHTCDIFAVPIDRLSAAAATLDGERDVCSQALDAGCQSPAIACPSMDLRPACIQGSCALALP